MTQKQLVNQLDQTIKLDLKNVQIRPNLNFEHF